MTNIPLNFRIFQLAMAFRSICLGALLAVFCVLSGCGGAGETANPNPLNLIAIAGQDQSIFRGHSVTVTGLRSPHPAGHTLAYRWELASKPAASKATLRNFASSSLTFYPDVVGDYKLQLVVASDGAKSDPDFIDVQVINRAPVANAGEDKTIGTGATTTMNAAGSTDADGDTLAYAWRLVAKPSASKVSVPNAKQALLPFVPDVVGTYEFELIVDDGTTSSKADNILLTVTPPSTDHLFITSLQVENSIVPAAPRTNVPITFGQVFAEGDVMAGKTVLAHLRSTGELLPFQVDAKATHADGSLRHAVLTAVLPSLAAGPGDAIELVSADNIAPTSGIALADVLKTTFDAVFSLKLGAITYSASARNLLQTTQAKLWLDGPLATEWEVSAPFITSTGAVHPHLAARFSIRAYKGLESIWVSAVVENNRTFEPGAQNFSYDVSLTSSGKEVYAKLGLTHYHHARWRKVFWWGKDQSVHLKHDTKYLINSKAVPNYDQSLVVPESALAEIKKQITDDKVGPMAIGLAEPYMPKTGGRQDIGPLTRWSAVYLLSMDKRAKDAMLATAEGAASWPIHYRDETTNLPVRLDQDTDRDPNPAVTNKDISVHSNLANGGPLPVPRCANNNSTLCATPITPDTAHQPSFVYLPYLVTGDHYYLEEMQFWSAWNPLLTSPTYRDFEKGLLKFDQVRAQAWSLRTLLQNAYIAPDSDPLKKYFLDQVRYNSEHYNQTYVNNVSANKLGWLNYISDVGTNKPWMDDFFTWSTNYAIELGFEEFRPVLQWKSKYPVGRMTAPGYCWIIGGVYEMKVAPTNTAAPYVTFKEAHDETLLWQNGGKDAALITMPCGGAQMATYLNLQIGEMTGYSSSPTGFPSNMQPALAAAVDSGIVNATQAWTVFMNRTIKPNYAAEPQFAIIPRL